MTKPTAAPATGAFFAQSATSFGISLAAVAVGVAYLPVDGWVRAFLAIAVLYAITSAFTLAKVVRDRQESTALMSRVDQARLEKLLAEHDPYREPAL
ncbi:YiaA/YiaB family inner membrane protein [Amycolatopsis granulosa]|uniref:YiaA/YiaB family inner membrane protein n=1 Tax=Amycolatopsis granulosa TaxID=185684 RepID=UPI00141E45D6|nr:YiaA/YiaB family inner membrane protein [Amycolatopsis granulosa]NIH86397.1 hypothetical protein [Amycolatopsis granulosa]